MCLDVFGEPKTTTSKLCALVAYYPTNIPDPRHRFTSSFRVLVHLAQGSGDNEETVGIVRRPEVLGIQARRKVVQKRVTPGIGAGGLLAKVEYPCYTYEGVDPGFAEHDLDEYDAVADAIAWSRSLSLVRRGFGAEVNLERVWEDNVERTRTLQLGTWSKILTASREIPRQEHAKTARDLRQSSNALGQLHANHDWRLRQRRTQALLRRLLPQDQPAITALAPCVANSRRRSHR